MNSSVIRLEGSLVKELYTDYIGLMNLTKKTQAITNIPLKEEI